ncbi:MAG: YdcF family protein [Sphingomonadaceae bacterium]|nr:YdcF family protein [Sphingomonadaceae bacterium]
MRNYVIVFGAAVRPGGSPSAALQHRIDGAVAWARRDPEAIVIPTGGVGDEGPAEADVMRRCLIAAGIATHRIVVERLARDTLESVRLCDAILRERGDCRIVVCCTSGYRQPRCALLLRLLGYKVVVPGLPERAGSLSSVAQARLILKEFVATPYDVALLLARRLTASHAAA